MDDERPVKASKTWEDRYYESQRDVRYWQSVANNQRTIVGRGILRSQGGEAEQTIDSERAIELAVLMPELARDSSDNGSLIVKLHSIIHELQGMHDGNS